ncbi:hypothetical protein [Hymenobacter sp. YC55]|uniref:hypothetical protein n=1 Tax=Hymenobacter sp. YC55 TaxID=3034019 RepID=UPI0023F8B9C9|nr:hypothetical protein [Hymenobacter sp. YC55]MDF7809828.1 hypothetical protein [Hymenobacter sp. YC55]
MKKALLIISTVLLALGNQSCEKEVDTPCVAGTLLGTTCTGGYLIQVDTTSQHTIGEAVAFQGDSGSKLPGPAAKFRVYNNVIVTHTALPANMQRGQRFYFQYEPGSDANFGVCTANVYWYQAPQYNVLGISDTSCSGLLPE